jgi:hypothetical protein
LLAAWKLSSFKSCLPRRSRRGGGSILKSQPDVKEVCVKKVYPLRFSAEHGQQKYEEFFKQFNDTMHT